MQPEMWLQPKSAHPSSSSLYKKGNYGFKIVPVSFIMDIKPIFLHEKLRMGVLLVLIIEKYKEIDKNLRFLQFSEQNWWVLLRMGLSINDVIPEDGSHKRWWKVTRGMYLAEHRYNSRRGAPSTKQLIFKSFDKKYCI